jgi:AcrR family transcriptional regulator
VSTLFRHFRDGDGVTEALTHRITERVLAYLALPPVESPDLRDRVSELVRRRVALFEEIGAFVRAGSSAPGRRAHHLGQRSNLEHQLGREARKTLEPALTALPAAEAKAVLEAAGVLLSLDGWAHLRQTRGLGMRATEAILVRGVLAVVGVGPGAERAATGR